MIRFSSITSETNLRFAEEVQKELNILGHNYDDPAGPKQYEEELLLVKNHINYLHNRNVDELPGDAVLWRLARAGAHMVRLAAMWSDMMEAHSNG